MWHGVAEKPESGKRIVAVYEDGSGTRMFLVCDAGPDEADGTVLVDSDGDEMDDLRPESYSAWAYLPDDFKLWFETRSE